VVEATEDTTDDDWQAGSRAPRHVPAQPGRSGCARPRGAIEGATIRPPSRPPSLGGPPTTARRRRCALVCGPTPSTSDLGARAVPAIRHPAINIIAAFDYSGRLDEAEQLLSVAWESATEQHAVHAQAWFGLLYGTVMTSRGRIRSALQWYERSSACFAATGLEGRRQWALAGALQSAVLLGRTDRAAELTATLNGIHSCVRLNHVMFDDARAWQLAVGGDRARPAHCC
jgi:hypothetical protein